MESKYFDLKFGLLRAFYKIFQLRFAQIAT